MVDTETIVASPRLCHIMRFFYYARKIYMKTLYSYKLAVLHTDVPIIENYKKITNKKLVLHLSLILNLRISFNSYISEWQIYLNQSVIVRNFCAICIYCCFPKWDIYSIYLLLMRILNLIYQCFILGNIRTSINCMKNLNNWNNFKM